MSIGIQSTTITVNHVIPADSMFGDSTTVPVECRCYISRITSTEDALIGAGNSSNLAVRVRVIEPTAPNVSVKDSFTWHGNLYHVTALDDGIMEENKVVHLPARWLFKAETVIGGN